MAHPRLETTSCNSNNGKTEPSLVILCPHDDDGETFLADYPEILEACRTTREVMERYLTLERDHGSRELSQAIMDTFMHETHGDYQSVLLIDRIPRAILDTNRIAKTAIRDIFDQKIRPALTKKMYEEHEKVMLEKRRVMGPLGRNGGVFLDIHTMAPYSRGDEVALKPGNMNVRNYIDSYVYAREQGGKRRKLDLITKADPIENVADKRLTDWLKAELTASGVEWDENAPYTVPMAYGILSSYNMLQFNGIAIDVPKDYLTDVRAEDSTFDILRRPNIDTGKVQDLAAIIARATIKRLRGDPMMKSNTKQ